MINKITTLIFAGLFIIFAMLYVDESKNKIVVTPDIYLIQSDTCFEENLGKIKMLTKDDLKEMINE